MDLKGRSWVGDMFNKFESMRVEVEDIISQDTVKYVENQILSVGANVKKFYSEVMDDLLPPSSLDPIKEEKSVCEVQDHVDASISEKTNVKTEGGSVNSIAEQKVKDSIIIADANKNADHGISSSVCYVNKSSEPQLHSSVEQDRASDSDILESQCAIKDLYNRQDSEHKSSDISTLNADVEKYQPKELTCYMYSEIDEHLCKVRGVVSDLTSVLEVNKSKEDGVGISEGMIENNGDVDAVEETKPTVAFSGSMSTNTIITPCVGPAIAEPVDISANVDETLNPSTGSETESGDADNLDALVFNPLKLGESCVLVGKNRHSFKLPLLREQKSYKKKIMDAFFRKRWLKGKHDKEQLAVWYEEQKAAETQDSQQNDCLELDWELL